MHSGILQWGIFIGLSALVAVLTWWRCRRAVHDTANDSREFFLAGGGLTWPVVAGSLLLTNISAEQIVGMNGAQMALVAWWEFGAAVGLIVLAKVLIPLYYKYRCTTTTELLEHRFNDAGIRAGVGVLFLFGYQFILLPVVLYTGSVFMKSMFGLDFPVLGIAAVFALAGLAYAAFGGLRAIAISDTFNGIGLLVMGLTVTVFALNAIGWDFSGIPAERLTLIGDSDSDIPWHTLLTGMLFIHLFYWGTNMVIAQRAMAARTVQEAQRGIYAAAAFKMVIPLIVVLPGIIAFKLYGDIDDVAYGRLVGDVLPPWLSGAFAAVIAGAVLSSFNSCLNSAAALYTLDVHVRYIDPNANVRRIGQIVAVIATVGAVALVPLYQHSTSIIATLQQLNGLYSMPVLAVFLAAVFFARPDARAAKIALVFGAALYAFFTFGFEPLRGSIDWIPQLHYIHRMFITLCACLLLMKLLGRAQAAPVSSPA
jgi:SSS family solute:Na+ symporter